MSRDFFYRLHPYLAYLTGYITLAGTQSCPHQSGIDHEERIRLKTTKITTNGTNCYGKPRTSKTYIQKLVAQ